MCTPSLAIDAIIEIHSSRPDLGTNAHEGVTDWPISRKSCLSIRGEIPPDENNLNGQDKAKSAPLVRAAKEALLTDRFSAGKKRVLVDSRSMSNKAPVDIPSSTSTSTSTALDSIRIHLESSHRLRHRRMQHGLNTRAKAIPSLNNTLESEYRFSGSQKKKSGISIVLVFRRDPPSGFAIPGGACSNVKFTF